MTRQLQCGLCGLLVMVAGLPSTLGAQTIGFEDFDGGAINLISGFDPGTQNINGGGGDFYGVGSLSGWPQGFPPGVPFSLGDDSIIGISGGTRDAADSFPTDLEGIYGQAADPNNNFFALSDLRDETAAGAIEANWLFDISGSTNDLRISIDMGQQSDGASFGGITAANLVFEYSLDGGAFQTLFQLSPFDASGTGYTYRAMDDGDVPTVASVLSVSGMGVQKLEADTGLLSTNLFLNKTPASGAGAGLLDTFFADITTGGASQLDLRLTISDFPFEALAFDNIRLSSVAAIPEPGTLGIGFGLLGWVVSRRRKRESVKRESV